MGIKLRNDLVVEVLYTALIFLSTVTTTTWISLDEMWMVSIAFRVLRYLLYGGFCFVILGNFLSRKYTKEGMLYLLIMAIFSFISMLNSGERTFLIATLLFGAIYGMNSKRLIRGSLLAQGCVLIMTVALALTGIVENVLVDEERRRYSLGFEWASFAPNLFLFIALQYIYLRGSKIKWGEYLAIEAINIILFAFTDTKMCFLLLTVSLFILALCKRFGKVKKFLKSGLLQTKKIFIGLPIVGAILASVLPFYKMDSVIWEILNSGFSGRMQQSKQAVITYGFTLFGQKTDMAGFSVSKGAFGGASNYVDSSYLQIALEQGFFVLIIVVALYMIAIYKAFCWHDYYMVGIMVLICVFCIEDPFLLDLPFNVFPIWVFCDKDIFEKIPLLQKATRQLNGMIREIYE